MGIFDYSFNKREKKEKKSSTGGFGEVVGMIILLAVIASIATPTKVATKSWFGIRGWIILVVAAIAAYFWYFHYNV